MPMDVTTNDYLYYLMCCLPEPQLDCCYHILRPTGKVIFIRFSGLSNQGAKELLPTAESPQAFHYGKKLFAYLYT